MISLMGAIPFGGLLIAFIIVLCRRKIRDWYLRWSMGVFIAAMGLRVAMSSLLMLVDVMQYKTTGDQKHHALV